ncbi:MAG TPA: hypothetical protein VN249_02925, partial [Prolixibacteraceae bacterium]|nr:hypothetical protein [Prolixibacteraceae bacterium]
SAKAQNEDQLKIPEMPDHVARRETLERDWAAMQQSPHRLAVRDGYLFLLDALDTRFLNEKQVEWVLKELQTRVISDTSAPSYGNMYWGWHETGGDVGDGNNVQFCVQYGILIKILFNDRLSPEARKTLDQIFDLALKGVRMQKVRISYTNIYLMRIWNMVALGQVYKQPSVVEEGRRFFDTWLNHVARYGNREYDSPTYCGVDLESLLLIHRFSADPDIRAKASDAIQFFMNDLCSHYNQRGGFLGGAHSRDYNRVFGRDLLEEKYMEPLLGKKSTNTHLFHQVCLAELQKIGLTPQQKELMNRKNRFIVQRWDSLAHTYACDFVGNKVSVASSNQSYSPDDKAFAIYLSSQRIPQMLNIAYNMEGRDDHYGTWAAEGMGEKMKHLMPANYPSNGGWGKTRHLMYFMQSAQNKGEFVMLALGEKDHNCIRDHLNSTIILPNTFDEIWLGNEKISIPPVGQTKPFDQTNTFTARFEDVAIAIRILWDNAGQGVRMALCNDGFNFKPGRENFSMANSSGLRLTLQHPGNGKGAIAMWWKTEEGIKTEADFQKFRQKILNTPVNADEKDGILDISVKTPLGKLGVKTDIVARKRLNYYNPATLPDDYLFNVDGVEIGRPIMEKYKYRK